ncbi:leukocyte elastase inhibitor-like [Drosophila elegans]|uniref:leukocyte elastase inhibitor-like n=1 Tax=Drosophila elegans TaxID=30023 RepID=UPI001BC8660C|nr:leukocyte elastase inhibitor-like [Drosophila elegans]
MTSKVGILLLALGHLEVTQSLAKPETRECLAPTYMTRFSAKLFPKIIKSENKLDNIFFSPYAVHAMLALIYRASEGETLNEVQRVGEFNQHPVFVALDFERLIKFKERLQIPVTSGNSAYPTTLSLRSTLLISTVRFLGFWEHTFYYGNTRPTEFHLANGRISNVDMMYNHKVYGLADLPDLDATALELPFKDSATNMLIPLPNQPNELVNLEQQLAQPEFDLNRIANCLHRQSVTVGLPRFRVVMVFDMNAPLKQLGLNQMFTDSSKVTELLDLPVRVDKVLQRAHFTVFEDGTSLQYPSGPEDAKSLPANSKEFVANRPIVFAIRTPNSVLLMGHVKSARIYK